MALHEASKHVKLDFGFGTKRRKEKKIVSVRNFRKNKTSVRYKTP